ncbi:MAG TPA: MFS transporter [Clostridium sp.]|nr:MFS transporter [Clostridium sp.]
MIEKETKKWTIFLIIVISTFMSTLDASIVNVALPNMADELGVTTSNIQLVVVSYLVTISAVILIFGRLGDIFGKTKIFKIGLLLFTIGSLLCGITHSFGLLIFARVIQAIGAAGTMANNQGIITEVFPANERGKALGLNGTAVALGSLVGSGLGGFIVGAFSWEFIFLINIPIGVIALLFAVKLIPKSDKIVNEPLDIIGAVLFMLTIIPLFVALNSGIRLGFTSPLILGGFAVAIVCFIAFLAVEKRVNSPLIDLSIFKNKLFSISIICGFISFIAIFSYNIVIPFYLQNLMGFSPQKAGFILMAYPLILVIVAPISGSLSDKIGSEFLTFLGLVIGAVGLFLIGTFGENTSIGFMILCIAIMSVGMGIFQSPNNSLVMSTVSKDKLGIAGSINALIRNMGMSTGIALATTLLYTRMSAKIGYRVTDFVEGRNDVFIYGMRWVFITAAVICLVGALITFYRMHRYSKEKN